MGVFSTWKGLHRAVTTSCILTALWLLYLILGYAALPPLAQSVLTRQLSHLLERRVVIDAVRFNPLTLRAQVQGLAVYSSDNSTVDLALGLLDVDVQASSLVRGALVFKRIAVNDPAVFIHILDASGTTNLTDLIAVLTKQEPDAEKGPDNDALFPVIVEDLACTNGTLRVQDDPKDMTQVVDGICLTIPYCSTRKKDQATQILPRLAFRLNTTPFELQGASLPFSATRRTRFDLSGSGLDLTAFWNYLPQTIPMRLVSGRAAAKASLVLEVSENGTQPLDLFLAGRFELDDANLRHTADGTVLACNHLVAHLKRFSLVRQEVAFTSIQIKEPCVLVTREEGDVLNWQRYLSELGNDMTHQEASASDASDDPPLVVTADSILVQDGTITYKDHVVDQGFATTLFPVHVDVRHFDTRSSDAAHLHVTARAASGEHLTLDSHLLVSPFAWNGTCLLTNATLPSYAPYYAALLPLELDQGKMDMGTGFRITTDPATQVRLDDLNIQSTGMRLRKPGEQQACLAWDTLSLTGGHLDLAQEHITFANATLMAPSAALERDDQGRVDILTLFAGDPEPQPSDTDVDHASVPASHPWMVGIEHISCRDGALGFTDYGARYKAVSRMEHLDADVEHVHSDGDQPMAFSLKAQVNTTGRLRAQGTLDPGKLVPGKLVPGNLVTQGRLEVSQFGLAGCNAYLPSSMQIECTEGLLDLAGTWKIAVQDTGQGQAVGTIGGDVRIADCLIRESGTTRPLVGYSSLDVTGITLGLNPHVLRIDSMVLTEPELTLVKNEEGVLNLVQALGGGDTKDDGAVQEPTAATTTHPYFFKDIDIAKTQVVQGTVRFYDHSLSPDFTADLSQIQLELEQMSLNPDKRAGLDVNATLNGHAPFSITGEVSPLQRPLASDLAVRLAHLDMTCLTPYTIQALAYPISQGKLDWKGRFSTSEHVLEASNTFAVQQLELGDKVVSPDAANIPIKLGLALLQDGNGDLSLDVPVRGRLDDPQFRLGGVIMRAIIGIFAKIATAPFALIGAMFGGGDDLSFVACPPGQAVLEPASVHKLDTLITALNKRPRLKVFVTGWVDLVQDRQILEDQAFMRLLKAHKFHTGRNTNGNVDDMIITPEEYPAWVAAAYRTVIAETPGSTTKTKEQPTLEEMEAVIRQTITIREDDLLNLATRRSQSVQHYLLEQGGIASERVFATSPQTSQNHGTASRMGVELSLDN
ncbi:MAG: hypothetical protein CSA21_01820 [Deltaproteobacteria bacterium]|nr:MAG: hypothetical protein CSA21_01820 [Deltaproteobacteria bacterium]